MTTLTTAVQAANTCNGTISLSYLSGQNYSLPGDVLRVSLTVGAGPIAGGTELTLNRLRFELDCAAPGVPCPDLGAFIEYEGDSTITTDCMGVTWSTGHAPGASPNEVVFTPSAPIALPAGSFAGACSVEFDVKVLALSGSSIAEFAGYTVPGQDARCNNGLFAGVQQPGTLSLCPPCDVCNGAETCNQDTGQCIAGTPVTCTATPIGTPTATPTSMVPPLPTLTATVASSPAPTGTQTPTAPAGTNGPSPTNTPTGVPSGAPTTTGTPDATNSPTPTPTGGSVSPASTPEASPTSTATASGGSPAPSAAATPTPTGSVSPASPPEASPTSTATASGGSPAPSAAATPTPTGSVSPASPPGGSPTSTATASAGSPTPSAAVTPTPSPTRTPARCVGDCNGDGRVLPGEVLHCVGIALGSDPFFMCTACDANLDGRVLPGEVLTAVDNSLNGCR